MSVTHLRATAAFSLVVLALGLAACGSAGSARHAKVGNTVTTRDGRFARTAVAYQQPAAGAAASPSRPGYVWAAAQVKDCQAGAIPGPSMALPSTGVAWAKNGGSAGVVVVVTRTAWRLHYSDGTVLSPSTLDDQRFVQPEYPQSSHLAGVGDCASGWIMYAVPKSAKPSSIEYVTGDETIEWTLG